LSNGAFDAFIIETLRRFQFPQRFGEIRIQFADGADRLVVQVDGLQQFLVDLGQEWSQQLGVGFAVHRIQIDRYPLRLLIIQLRDNRRHRLHAQLFRCHDAMISAQQFIAAGFVWTQKHGSQKAIALNRGLQRFHGVRAQILRVATKKVQLFNRDPDQFGFGLGHGKIFCCENAEISETRSPPGGS
jgi:hypothetical protein